MKVPNFIRPVQQWFKTVGQIGKHRASTIGDHDELEEPKEVIKSPQKEPKKKGR